MHERAKKHLATVSVVFALVACQSKTETYHEPVMVGSTHMLLTTADLRTVAERPHPMGDKRTIICTEPPPDVAKALSTALALSASGGNGSVQGSLSGNSASAEQLAELTGRVPGLLALRDTLFRACEAYGNGMLGDDAYGLIVSRYGEMLTTLILGDALSTNSAALAKLEGLNLGQSPSQNPDKKPQTSPSASKPPKSAPMSDFSSPARSFSARQLPSNVEVQIASLDPAFVQATPQAHSDRASPATGQNGPSSPASVTRPPTAPNSNAAKGKKQPSASKQAPKAATNNSGPETAQALEQMQANYMALGILGPLMVACVNEHDPTRRGMYPAEGGAILRQNDLLGTSFCSHYIQQLTQLEMVERLKKANASASQIEQVIGPHE